MNVGSVAKAVATVLWADEKDTPEEWGAAESIFKDNGGDWEAAKPLIEREIESLIDEDPEGSDEESEEDLHLGVIDVGDCDQHDVLFGLARLACADKEVTLGEIEVLHAIGDAMNVQKQLVSAALVKAVAALGAAVSVD